MPEHSLPIDERSARRESPVPAAAPLRRPAALTTDPDTRHADVCLAAVLGSTLLGVSGGQRPGATRAMPPR